MAVSDSASQSSQVKSATRTLDIIEYVVAHNRPLVAQEIAVALGIPVSSLSYLLGTLVDRGYLAREGRRYSAGPGLERLQARTHGFTLAERAAPLVRALRVQLNETASFWATNGRSCATMYSMMSSVRVADLTWLEVVLGSEAAILSDPFVGDVGTFA